MPASTASCEQWDVYDVPLTGPASGNPFVDVELAAQFTCGDVSIDVTGFYDGDGVYRVRFMPPAQGKWTYETKSNRAELRGKTGSFTATPPTGNNHGPVRVHD